MRDLWCGQERRDKSGEGNTRKAAQEASRVVQLPLPRRKGGTNLSASRPCRVCCQWGVAQTAQPGQSIASLFPVSRAGWLVETPDKQWEQLCCDFNGTLVLLRPLCRSGPWPMHHALGVWLCCVKARATA